MQMSHVVESSQSIDLMSISVTENLKPDASSQPDEKEDDDLFSPGIKKHYGNHFWQK